jgi:uncharacterized membrane protein
VAPAKPRDSERDIGRILAYSDGVFAIAATLLVLNIRIPTVGPNAPAMSAQLLRQWPMILAYFISFFVIGGFWVGHHRTFGYLVRWDRRLLWLNLVLLFCIAFMPVPTGMIGQRTGEVFVTVFYASWVLLTGLVAMAIWAYCAWNGRLISAELEPRQALRVGLMQNGVSPAIFALSIPVAFFSTAAASVMWVLVALVQFVLTPAVDGRWGKFVEPHIDEEAA